jgi:hypothetical protein
MAKNNVFGVAMPSLGLPNLTAPTLPTSAPDSSNLTIDQLRNLDRALTPAELARLDAADQASGDAEAKTVEAKGGPKAAVLSATAKGAVLQAEKSVSFFDENVPGVNKPVWQVMLAGIGVVALSAGIYAVASSGGGRRRVAYR